MQSQINQLRLRAKAQTTQAEGLSVPGDMKPAQRNLLLSLGLVEESMGKVAEKIPAALSTDAATAEPAVLAITGRDAVLRRRRRRLHAPHGGAHQAGARRPRHRRADDPGRRASCPNLGWLDAPTVARRIHADAGRGAGADGLDAAAGAGPARPRPARRERRRRHARRPARTPPTASPASVERDVQREDRQPGREHRDRRRACKVTIRGGGKTITAQKTVDQTTPGTEATVAVPLEQAPPIGVGVKITVEVRKVPGEMNTTNNKAEYPAIFRRS